MVTKIWRVFIPHNPEEDLHYHYVLVAWIMLLLIAGILFNALFVLGRSYYVDHHVLANQQRILEVTERVQINTDRLHLMIEKMNFQASEIQIIEKQVLQISQFLAVAKKKS